MPRKTLTDADVTVETEIVQIPAPDLQVTERGLANVFGLPSTDIKLKDPRFQCHWCNTDIGGNQLGKYLDAGYLKVRPEYLADPDRVAFTVSPEGYVVTGSRGAEILLYSTKENVLKRAQEKARINSRGMRNVKSEVVEAAGAQLGDEAANYLNRTGAVVGGVRDSYERVQRTGEDEA